MSFWAPGGAGRAPGGAPCEDHRKETRMSRAGRAGLAALVFVSAAASGVSAQPQLFSGGSYIVPETISLAPPEFGRYGGSYFIPDAGLGIVWTVPATGGPPV